MPPCQPTWQTSIEHLTHTCAPNMGQIMVKAQLCDTDPRNECENTSSAWNQISEKWPLRS